MQESTILLQNCKKRYATVKDRLPPITQEGKNTFGCRVNGDLYYTTELTEKLKVQEYARRYGSMKKGIQMLIEYLRTES